MAIRILGILLLAFSLQAQVANLAPAFDGSSVLFTSSLRLRGSSQPFNSKVFLARDSEVMLFRSRQPEYLNPGSPLCEIGGFVGFTGAEISSNGATALEYSARTASCTHPISGTRTVVTSGPREYDLSGSVRLSSDGNFAIAVQTTASGSNRRVDLAYVDLATGESRTIDVQWNGFPESMPIPLRGGHVVANDGTFVLGIENQGHLRGLVFKPGAGQQNFNIDGAAPIFISADAKKILYQDDRGISIQDENRHQNRFLVELHPQGNGNLSVSDDLRRLLYWQNNELHVVEATTAVDRILTVDPSGVQLAAISGNGDFAFVITGGNRLLRLDLNAGTIVQWIGETPDINLNVQLTAGFNAELRGVGLGPRDTTAAAPLPTTIDGVSLYIGEKKVALRRVTPESVAFLTPWNPATLVEPGGRLVSHIRLEKQNAGDTPFALPEGDIENLQELYPGAGPVLRDDWQLTYVGPVRTREVIHVYSVGFGPVLPDVPTGAAAPAMEPFARLSQPLKCSNAEVLYAGLAPGAIERVYQIDLRIGETAGYQQFSCTLGEKQFIFLTLLVNAM